MKVLPGWCVLEADLYPSSGRGHIDLPATLLDTLMVVTSARLRARDLPFPLSGVAPRRILLLITVVRFLFSPSEIFCTSRSSLSPFLRFSDRVA